MLPEDLLERSLVQAISNPNFRIEANDCLLLETYLSDFKFPTKNLRFVWQNNIHKIDNRHGRLSFAEAIRENIFQPAFLMVVDQAFTVLPETQAAAISLEREIGNKWGFNLYFSKGFQEGFSRHKDNHEVTTLQIVGSKYWKVETELGSDYYELHSGDTLKIESNTFHQVSTASEISISIAIGRY